MVSWSNSFIAALKVIGFSLIWWIVGGIVVLISLGMISNPMMGISSGRMPDMSVMFTGFIVMTIGYIIALVGSLAAFMKVLTELIAQEIKH